MVGVAGRLASDFVDLQIERNGALADLQRSRGMQHKVGFGGIELPQHDQQPWFFGSAVLQLDAFCASAARIGMTATGGRVVLGSSPQVKSIPISIEKKKNDSDAVPWTCQGAGPYSVTSMPTPYTPTPKT